MATSWCRRPGRVSAISAERDLAQAVALAFPDRLSPPPRSDRANSWQSVGGRGFRLDPASPLARSEWLAVAEVAGAASGARILSAAAIDWPTSRPCSATGSSRSPRSASTPPPRRSAPRRGRRLGAIRLSSAPDPKPDQAAIEAALLDGGAPPRPGDPAVERVARWRCATARRSPRAHDPSIPRLERRGVCSTASTNGCRRCSAASAGSTRSTRQRSASRARRAARL